MTTLTEQVREALVEGLNPHFRGRDGVRKRRVQVIANALTPSMLALIDSVSANAQRDEARLTEMQNILTGWEQQCASLSEALARETGLTARQYLRASQAEARLAAARAVAVNVHPPKVQGDLLKALDGTP